MIESGLIRTTDMANKSPRYFSTNVTHTKMVVIEANDEKHAKMKLSMAFGKRKVWNLHRVNKAAFLVARSRQEELLRRGIVVL